MSLAELSIGTRVRVDGSDRREAMHNMRDEKRTDGKTM